MSRELLQVSFSTRRFKRRRRAGPRARAGGDEIGEGGWPRPRVDVHRQLRAQARALTNARPPAPAGIERVEVGAIGRLPRIVRRCRRAGRAAVAARPDGQRRRVQLERGGTMRSDSTVAVPPSAKSSTRRCRGSGKIWSVITASPGPPKTSTEDQSTQDPDPHLAVAAPAAPGARPGSGAEVVDAGPGPVDVQLPGRGVVADRSPGRLRCGP